MCKYFKCVYSYVFQVFQGCENYVTLPSVFLVLFDYSFVLFYKFTVN